MSQDDVRDFDPFQDMIIPYLNEITRDSISPPKAQVDEASLQRDMNKNKESLKVKLMTRRPINQLVEQGILPSLKVTPHFHEQRQKLERAKTGDFLKNKIQRRPDRQALIEQHILEDTTVDPSLHDKQRQLKKARLADDLNDRLSHRPGPLELVKGNILQADEKFAQAVKEGQIPFKKTCEGQSLRHPPPVFVFEEDSSSDVALSPPQDNVDQTFGSLPSVDSMVYSPYSNLDSPSSSHIEPPKPVVVPQLSCPSVLSPPSQVANSPQNEAVPKEVITPVVRIRKKLKPKSQPKPRTIKFHEYKGPPSAQKNPISALQDETSYELLLKQQQLFLQWQLEWQQKYPQILLPQMPQKALDQNSGMNNGNGSLKESAQENPSIMPVKCWSKLEDMKVSDLKAELKKRNLPVSGPKPQLIERLKPYSEFAITIANKKIQPSAGHLDSSNGHPSEKAALPSISVSGIILDTRPALAPNPEPVASMVVDNKANVTLRDTKGPLLVYNTLPAQGQILVSSRPSSAAPMDIDVTSLNPDSRDNAEMTVAANENIVKLQQQRIEELQRELQKSQLQLQHQQWLQQQARQQQALLTTQPVPLTTTIGQLQQVPVNTVHTTLPQHSTIDTKALQKLQQHLQQKLQQQQLLHQLQSGQNNITLPTGTTSVSAAVKANLAAFIHNQQNVNIRTATALNQPQAVNQLVQPILFCHSGTYAENSDKPRAHSLPNGFGHQRTSSLPNFSAVVTAKPVNRQETKLVPKPPPNYSESTKQTAKTKQESNSKGSGKSRRSKSVKSQAVDDVLEILIKNGELPPSAAQQPPTPTTPDTPTGAGGSSAAQQAPPAFPTAKLVPPPPSSASVSQCPPPPVPQPPRPLLASGAPSLATAGNSLPSSVLHNHAADSSLGFDFQLELHDIEPMDLGVLDSHRDSLTNGDGSSHGLDDGDLSSRTMDSAMDLELNDWLENLTSSSSLDNQPASSPNLYSNCGGDPLLSNHAESFDMLFPLEEMDFKTPADMNLLGWDKVDFAT